MPKDSSSNLIRCRFIMGSRMLVHNEVVAIPARHTEAVDTRAEVKNSIQCPEIIRPVASIFKILAESILILVFKVSKIRNKPADAIIVLKKTSSIG